MSLAERLQAELKSAMRDRDELRRETLRMVLAAAQYAEKQARRPLADEELLGVFAHEVKTRRESVEAFEKGGRPDLAAKERAEIDVLSSFLPSALGEEELRSMVRDAIAESGATSGRDLGRVMRLLSPRTRNRADGRQVSHMVAQELARADLAVHTDGH